jgi:hypothetical protein
MSHMHFDDEHIYEKYLMGQLSDKERREFEEYLKDCSECREKLADEEQLQKKLAAHYKRAFKAEILKHTDELRRERKRNSHMMLKSAAMIMIMILTPVAFYYYQFGETEELRQLLPPKPIAAKPEAESNGSGFAADLAKEKSERQESAPGEKNKKRTAATDAPAEKPENKIAGDITYDETSIVIGERDLEQENEFADKPAEIVVSEAVRADKPAPSGGMNVGPDPLQNAESMRQRKLRVKSDQQPKTSIPMAKSTTNVPFNFEFDSILVNIDVQTTDPAEDLSAEPTVVDYQPIRWQKNAVFLNINANRAFREQLGDSIVVYIVEKDSLVLKNLTNQKKYIFYK